MKKLIKKLSKFRKGLKKPRKLRSFLVIVLVILAVMCSFADDVGSFIGTIAGKMLAPFVSDEEAKEKELSGESDTEVLIGNYTAELGNLQILSADVIITNFHEIGDKSGGDSEETDPLKNNTDTKDGSYQGLYVIEGELIFSVDLTKAKCSLSEDDQTLSVEIPEITFAVNPDYDTYMLLEEKEKFNPFVDAEDGYTSRLKSMNYFTENVESVIEDYEYLYSVAEESAINKVHDLVNEISGMKYTVNVSYEGEA